MIVPLRHPEHTERFTVRWVQLSAKFNILTRGYAVFDHADRITDPFAERAEAEQHRTNITALYARYGW